MESIDEPPPKKSFTRTITRHLNFYRIHMLFFTFTPLIAAAIFYASNGANKIAYVDCLFMCVSAMTVTGLNTVILSALTGWQQVILFILMTMGSTSSVSIVTILIRKHFFRKKFKYMVETDADARRRCEDVEAYERSYHRYHPHHMLDTLRHRGLPRSAKATEDEPGTPRTAGSSMFSARKKKRGPLTAAMVRRVDEPREYQGKPEEDESEKVETKAPDADADKLRDSTDSSTPEQDDAEATADMQRTESPRPLSDADEKSPIEAQSPHARLSEPMPRTRRMSDPVAVRQLDDKEKRFKRIRTADPATRRDQMPRAQTIEFADPAIDRQDLRRRVLHGNGPTLHHSHDNSNELRRKTSIGPSVIRSSTAAANHFPPRTATHRSAKTTGYGGFPNPIVAGFRFLHKRVPPALERATTMNRAPTMRAPTSASLRRTGTIYSQHSITDEGRPVNYISFDAIVGRNSHFHKLTTAQEEELGGVEYRALSVLLWIVIGYYLGVQLFCVAILGPYMSTARFDPIFQAPDGTGPVWFSFFQMWSAYSNLGMSLIDASLTVFQDVYGLLILSIFAILAGNTALPIFLRLTIWTMSKIGPQESRFHETLQFLLDHPRRCFIYLFPAYQTWFLVFVLIVLNTTDWVAFLVLDIGNSVLDQLPVNVRVIDGLMQSIAVRAAGFVVVPLSAVAPALQVLYVIMMYIAVYPIAMSIRSTNVYESRSMGLYEESDDEEEADERFEKTAHAGSYIAYHARKQLAFDLWWLVLGLWLICIIERDGIADPTTAVWFNQFTVIFEIASAYGTVGLSLGLPYSQTSLCGAFRTLSKLVLCAVMIRGRHRGLPNAIDRAVLLPSELSKMKAPTMRSSDIEGLSLRSRTRRPSMRFSQAEEDAFDDIGPAAPSSPAASPPASPIREPRRLSDGHTAIKFTDSFPVPSRGGATNTNEAPTEDAQ